MHIYMHASRTGKLNETTEHALLNPDVYMQLATGTGIAPFRSFLWKMFFEEHEDYKVSVYLCSQPVSIKQQRQTIMQFTYKLM